MSGTSGIAGLSVICCAGSTGSDQPQRGRHWLRGLIAAKPAHSCACRERTKPTQGGTEIDPNQRVSMTVNARCQPGQCEGSEDLGDYRSIAIHRPVCESLLNCEQRQRRHVGRCGQFIQMITGCKSSKTLRELGPAQTACTPGAGPERHWNPQAMIGVNAGS